MTAPALSPTPSVRKGGLPTHAEKCRAGTHTNARDHARASFAHMHHQLLLFLSFLFRYFCADPFVFLASPLLFRLHLASCPSLHLARARPARMPARAPQEC
eukprot:6187150-Pleurochrysis_carterae.AAC.4